jgi:hypothetical protein
MKKLSIVIKISLPIAMATVLAWLSYGDSIQFLMFFIIGLVTLAVLYFALRKTNPSISKSLLASLLMFVLVFPIRQMLLTFSEKSGEQLYTEIQTCIDNQGSIPDALDSSCVILGNTWLGTNYRYSKSTDSMFYLSFERFNGWATYDPANKEWRYHD